MNNKEYRSVSFTFDEAEDKKLRGYAAVFNSFSEDLGGFKEVILPGAFRSSIESGKDILALGHHNDQIILGRRSAGTLEIKEDDKGLYMEIDLPDTSEARDIREHVKLGNLKHMSFGFVVKEDDVYEEGGQIIRALKDVELFEVSVVAVPAYSSTEVAFRNLSERLSTTFGKNLIKYKRKLFDLQNQVSIEPEEEDNTNK